MATQAANINLSGLERRIDSVSEATRRIETELALSNKKIDSVSNDLAKVNRDLQALKTSFESFLNEHRKAAALQKAATELIRVRQELEQSFGDYKTVRETMLGVLQATDLALVKKTTISQVTEELMLSTPDYWLAPCLIAVSAWIGNDRDLADRAIAEAMKRDEEKTALTMALICRRNNRTDTCYEWLSIYFAKQTVSNFTRSNFTYLNAYLNGVFGPDEKHMCDDYVAKWMKEIQENGDDFESKQAEQWRAYCEDFTVNLEGQFPQMSACVHEYDAISAYVSRINSVDKIAYNFSKMKNVEVDQQKLKKDIDQTLVALISRYDSKEEPLRKEEQYLMAVRNFDGDTEAAKASILAAERKKREETIDLIGQMTNVIVAKEGVRPSEKKTAVSFLSSYIRNGFETYITEKKPTFPEQITLEVEDWRGVSTDGTNGAALKTDFEQHMERRRAETLSAIQTQRPQQLKIASLVLAVLGVICLVPMFPLGVILLIGAVGLFLSSSKAVKDIATNTVNSNADFDGRILSGKQKIDAALSEWTQAQSLVRKFESEQIRDIVA
ncbi:MAG: hypothetical protein HDT33_07165 [Clostridiales bacterium]|nr:hypothetical protein [Clostridiales bacterium]